MVLVKWWLVVQALLGSRSISGPIVWLRDTKSLIDTLNLKILDARTVLWLALKIRLNFPNFFVTTMNRTLDSNMDNDNHSCPQFPRYTSNFALACFLLCASILMLHLKTVFRAGCVLAFMFEKDGAVWQTCQGVISSSASGDNCTSLPASTSAQECFKMWTIVNCRKHKYNNLSRCGQL